MKHFARWQPAELAIMRTTYPVGGYKAVAALLPHRSLDTIRMRATKMGLRSQRRSRTA